MSSLKKTCICSLKTNSSLLRVSVEQVAADNELYSIFSEGECGAIKLFFDHNAHLPHLLDPHQGGNRHDGSSCTVLVSYWPLVFLHALQSQHGSHLYGIFQTLVTHSDTIAERVASNGYQKASSFRGFCRCRVIGCTHALHQLCTKS